MNAPLKMTKKSYEVLSEKERSVKIIRWIRFWDAKIRNRFPFLTRYQDTIGLGITLASALLMILFAGLYIADKIPFWLCIASNAFFSSLLHEIEHDLIHNLYHKGNSKIQNCMFWIVWLFRANTVNPWFRREIHLLHHKVSGNKEDVEERMIGNGMPFGLRRFLTMIDGNMALILQGWKVGKDAHFYLRKITAPRIIGPYRETFFFLWYCFLILNTFYFLNIIAVHPFGQLSFLNPILPILNTIAVVYLVPNWIRQTSIQVVSSNMHYYGDVSNVYNQTQVLNSWFVLPFHLFCFNFGATHGIHHFVVNQPFYLRQLTSYFVLPAMKRYGIRFNDFKSMLRGNSKNPTENLSKVSKSVDFKPQT
ncbi:fatty acid desaturase [Leptospira sp. 201903070]|uniref:Fatty acid desaturase n=1 Tax=Leptospira ainlahdjerensis TaxID=2810033 RepID=A0ABS2UGI4_9LEPT|nr:fatty acid desaturase [Leptospira ainlahdjerensis]MBM9579491.1 fatty acid desaturase [Leptospira ainlahdjerensis]